MEMEEALGDPLSVAKDASLIKESQSEIGKLDILVCGICHGVFHFVEEFTTHKADKCLESTVAKSCENDDKAQAWAFCLWKNKQMKSQPSSDKNSTMWSIYQKWCKLSQEARESWITGGQTLLSLNKIRIAKMQEVKFKVKREEEKDPLALTDNDMQGLDHKEEKNNATKSVSAKASKSNDSSGPKKDPKKEKDELKEYVVESILGKRFNAKKKHWEYKVKWENWDESQCSWEPNEHLTGCKALIHRFEEKLRLEKEKKKAPESPKAKPQPDIKTDDESTDPGSARRPQRSSKQKALNQVKRWLVEGSDNEGSNKSKRSLEDDDSDESFEKRMKLEDDSDESYEDEDEEKPKKTPNVKPRNITNGLAGKKIPHNVLIPDAQGIVRINQKQLPSLSSGVYIMSKTAGIIKLDSQTSKIAASGGQAVVKVAPRIGQTHIRIVKKDGGTTNRVIQMSPSKSRMAGSPMTPRTAVTHRVTKVVRQVTTPKAVRVDSKSNEQKKTTPLKEHDDIKESQSAADDDESDSGLPELEFPSEIVPPEPEETPSEFTLDPTTGKIAGMDYPDPEPEPEVTPEETKENPENTLDNIVKLAAADITEADLKPDLSEPMETDVTQEAELAMQETPEPIVKIEKKPEIVHREEMIRMRKEPTPVSRVQQKFMITPTVKNSNILERTLQGQRTVVKSPQGYTRQVYTTKSPQRILNSAMTPKLTSPMSPMVRTVVRSGYSSKPKQMFPKQRIYMSSPSSKFNESIIKQQYTKSNVNKRIGNIGSTTIYKRTSQPSRISSSPKVVARTNLVRKSTPMVRTVVQKSPKPVISMPSLMDDDLPAQVPETMQMIQKVGSISENSEAAISATSAVASTSEADLSSFTLNDGEAPIFITGDDGTVYQVAGQNEQGQTILITQGPDGQQQCLLVTSENAVQEESTQEENAQQAVSAAESGELPAQEAEAMEETPIAEETSTDPHEPLSIKTEQDSSDQVVAQVVRAEPPSPGGTHKVVVMLPDGNLMVTQVTPEEYASLELDK